MGVGGRPGWGGAVLGLWGSSSRCSHTHTGEGQVQTQQAQSPVPRAQPAEPSPGAVQARAEGPLGTSCEVLIELLASTWEDGGPGRCPAGSGVGGRASSSISVDGSFPKIRVAKPSLEALLGLCCLQARLVEEVGPNPCSLGLPFLHPSVCLPDCPAIRALLNPPSALSQALCCQHGLEQRFAELWKALGRSDLPRPCRTGAGLGQDGQQSQRPVAGSGTRSLSLVPPSRCICPSPGTHTVCV